MAGAKKKEPLCPIHRAEVTMNELTTEWRAKAAELSPQAAKGIAKASLDSGLPVVFGVLTTDSVEQAVERAGTKAGNKGWAAATTALEMANLLRVLP